MARTNQFFNKVVERIEKLDAEDRRRQFKALADEIGFLESVFNTLSEGILVVNADGLLLYSNAAADRLTATDDAVGEISYAVGIHDPLYFSKLFKKNYGMTPREYRLMHKKRFDTD